jgi:CheY-like chemotaxis protein
LATTAPAAIVFDADDCLGDIASLIEAARARNTSIYFTAFASKLTKQIQTRLTENGVQRILAKPCSLHALADAVAEADAKKSTLGSLSPSVLVVEDSTETAEVIEAYFNATGCTITVAASAERALELLPRHHYNALLLDLGLPGMDGVELLARIRHSGMRIPCVVVTGSYDPDDRKLLSDLGIEALFEKPTDFCQVTQMVSGLLK